MQPDQLPKPKATGDPTRGWQTLIRRDLPLVLAALFLYISIRLGNKLIDSYELRLDEEKERNNQYARIVVELAKGGHSATDLLQRSSVSVTDSFDAKNKADSN